MSKPNYCDGNANIHTHMHNVYIEIKLHGDECTLYIRQTKDGKLKD